MNIRFTRVPENMPQPTMAPNDSVLVSRERLAKAVVPLVDYLCELMHVPGDGSRPLVPQPAERVDLMNKQYGALPPQHTQTFSEVLSKLGLLSNSVAQLTQTDISRQWEAPVQLPRAISMIPPRFSPVSGLQATPMYASIQNLDDQKPDQTGCQKQTSYRSNPDVVLQSFAAGNHMLNLPKMGSDAQTAVCSDREAQGERRHSNPFGISTKAPVALTPVATTPNQNQCERIIAKKKERRKPANQKPRKRLTDDERSYLEAKFEEDPEWSHELIQPLPFWSQKREEQEH